MPLFFLFDRNNISIDLLSWKERWNAKLRWYDGESYGSIALLSEFTKQSREGDFAVMASRNEIFIESSLLLEILPSTLCPRKLQQKKLNYKLEREV